jgi:hypothetical protein
MSVVSLPAPGTAASVTATEVVPVPVPVTQAPHVPQAAPRRGSKGLRIHIPLVSTRIAGTIIAPYLV